MAALDLSMLDDELILLSGTKENVELFDALREQLGSDDPAVWAAPLLKRVRERKLAGKIKPSGLPANTKSI